MSATMGGALNSSKNGLTTAMRVRKLLDDLYELNRRADFRLLPEDMLYELNSLIGPQTLTRSLFVRS